MKIKINDNIEITLWEMGRQPFVITKGKDNIFFEIYEARAIRDALNIMVSKLEAYERKD